jgi:hypothetical protein
MSKVVIKEVNNLYLDELGITSPSEIDIEAIAFYKDAIVKSEVLTGCEARIIGAGDQAIITVNSQSDRERQRFSIGHELGHWFKDRGKIGNLCSHDDMNSRCKGLAPKEKIANSFASELLMPNYLVKDIIKDSPLTLDTVGLIKDSFKTSFMASLRKTISTNYHMGFFACYDAKGKRKYFSKNSDLHYYFSPPQQAPSGSCVFDLIFNDSKEQSAKILDGSVWCRNDSASHIVVHEHAFHYHNGDYITIVWWEDEEPIWKANESMN